MKRTIRQKIEDLLEYKKHEKQRFLDAIHEYQLKGEWEAAMKGDIKMRTIDRFINELEKALQ